jgi:hypothetical protein
MKKLLAVLVLGAAVWVSGCATNAPMDHYAYRPIASSHSSNFAQIAERVLTQRGWQVTAQRAGEIDASYVTAETRADITIEYTATRYEIEYRSSQGLSYSRGRIHRHYNNWISYIDRDIQNAMRGG